VGQSTAQDHAGRIFGVEPGSLQDMLVDTAYLGVPGHVDPPKRHACAGLLRSGKAAGEKSRGGSASGIVEPVHKGIRVLDAGVDGRIVHVALMKYLDVPQFELQDVSFHAFEVTLHEPRVLDHHEQGQAHGRHGNKGPPPVPPNVPPCHLEDIHEDTLTCV